MDCCHRSRPFARRSFLVTAYTVGDDGRFVATMPLQCVAGGSGPCRLRINHWRHRKTGPAFPLCVVECRTHGVGFTLYPPGHVPYGRVAIAPVDTAGRLLHAPTEHEPPTEHEHELGNSDAAQLGWGATVFGAAQDAAQGLPWARRQSSGPGSWRTQGRWIVLGALLLGLLGSPDHRSLDAGLLGVSGSMQRQSAAEYAAARGYRDRGRAVVRPLVDLEQSSPFALDWLLMAGFVAARWGPARRWDPHSGQLRDIVPRARAP